MKITSTRVKLIDSDPPLKAFCSVTFDYCFIVKDLKILDMPKGLIVAMPCRKLCERCNGCGNLNHLLAKFCNECGKPVSFERRDGRLYVDLAHPLNFRTRDAIERRLLEDYRTELARPSAELGRADGAVLEAFA